MSEPKFTPGPWILENFSGADKEIFISAEGDGWARLQATVSQDDCEQETAQANAHLIVAAPDLYEALKRLGSLPPSWGKTSWREGALCWCKVDRNDSDSAKDHSDVCNETRAALKLAGGK